MEQNGGILCGPVQEEKSSSKHEFTKADFMKQLPIRSTWSMKSHAGVAQELGADSDTSNQ
jgi:hypothetical protein